jgi:hypothetical protein
MPHPHSNPPSDSESDCLDEPSCELPSQGLSDEAQHLNNVCDKLAKQTAKEFLANPQQEVPPLLSPPYPGTRAMLRIAGDTWITSKYDYHIHLAARSLQMQAYCLERYGWTTEVFESIHWDCVGLVSFVRVRTCPQSLLRGQAPCLHRKCQDMSDNVGKTRPQIMSSRRSLKDIPWTLGLFVDISWTFVDI